AIPSQRAASAAGGRWQQSPSGHVDDLRRGVSRPRNQRECSYGVPSVIAKPRSRPWSTWATHQYVPDGGSAYWQKAEKGSAEENSCRPDHWRHIRCPSIAPESSAGSTRPSFSYAL